MLHLKTLRYPILSHLFATFALVACADTSVETTGAADAASVTTEDIINASATPGDWLSYGGGYDEQRHSLLTQINKETIGDLKPAWTYEMRRDRGVEATPIVVDGVMYVTGAWSIVYALDAKTGEEIWVHDPEVPGAAGVKGCCGVVNRGVAVLDGKVFVGAFDGRLQALDAKTGALLWSVVTVDQTKPYTVTGAPRAANGLVYIGNGGAELGVRGYLSAYDADTGELVWRFYTTPNPQKAPDNAASDDALADVANATWGDDGAWTETGGGGTVWDSIVYDAVNDTVIFGVGNGSPWNAKLRDPNTDGDNLFLSSIIAVDAKSGAYKWHFQTTQRDNWDYTATQTIILAELPLGENGAQRRVVMQAPKNGFFYVLDAATGEFINGDAFAPINWASGLDDNGHPIENPTARATENGALLIPGSHGAHNWYPMAFSPQTNLAYIPTHLMPLVYRDLPEEAIKAGHIGLGYAPGSSLPIDYPAGTIEALRGANNASLTAWDPVGNKIAWSVPLEEFDNSGVLSTAAGIIFQGDATGRFRAFDANNGDEIWRSDIKLGLMGAPTTYEVDAEQYVVLAAGMGGAAGGVFGFNFDPPMQRARGRVIAFKLGGEASVPDIEAAPIERTPKTEPFGDSETIRVGFEKFHQYCVSCHGIMAISSGVNPDLRWSYVSADADAWRSVVAEGALTENGMISFAPFMSLDEIDAIRAYVVNQGYIDVRNRAESEVTED